MPGPGERGASDDAEEGRMNEPKRPQFRLPGDGRQDEKARREARIHAAIRRLQYAKEKR